jgi:8-oxo-dGTP pyrophosphatase MutT (NUDIX family)
VSEALLADARAFTRTVDPRSRAGVELEGLLASGTLPIDRDETWHAVASLLVMDGSGSILLARNASGGWGTCGGHIEPDDPSIRAAVVREAQEELGLRLHPAALVPLLFHPDTMVFRPGHAHWDFCYLWAAGSQVAVSVADDVTDARWFAFDDLPELNVHMRALVDAAIAYG